jgi:hypothetical protein
VGLGFVLEPNGKSNLGVCILLDLLGLNLTLYVAELPLPSLYKLIICNNKNTLLKKSI